MRFLSVFTIALLVTSAAEAHTGIGAASGLAHGFLHPVGGLDHILAMVGVGLLGFVIGGRAFWLVPAAFVVMMALGGVLGLAGAGLPFVEAGIALSVIVIGAALAFGSGVPLALAMALAGGFAVFHGHAHGAEMPLAASGLAYGFGFLAATALLHAAGAGAGYALGKLAGAAAPRATRLGGAMLSLFGLAILTGVL
ncbi:HupE/UreJ family protein [Pelagibius sp. CAU 1746]|uniref:HupE/UreJ family protein n=1 Tax=Pelagibius sp. CAU 1746 TaxID=3140370 RepID=UPI00325B1F9A